MPFWKNGYDCSMQRGMSYTRPTGLSSFPAVASFPGPPPMDHWPNIISIIQTHDRVALAHSSSVGGDMITVPSSMSRGAGGRDPSVRSDGVFSSLTGSWRRRKRTESEASFLGSLFSGWGSSSTSSGSSKPHPPPVTATTTSATSSSDQVASVQNYLESPLKDAIGTATEDIVGTVATNTATDIDLISDAKHLPVSASTKSLSSLTSVAADESNDYTIDRSSAGSSRPSHQVASSNNLVNVASTDYSASATPTKRRSTASSSSGSNAKSTISVWTMADSIQSSSTGGLSSTQSRPSVKFYDRKVDSTYALAGIDGRLVLVATHQGAWDSDSYRVGAEVGETPLIHDAVFAELCATVGKTLRHEIKF